MHCFTTLTPSSPPTHSLVLRFFSPSAQNLILVKGNVLQVFSCVSGQQVDNGNDGGEGSSVPIDGRLRLVLEGEYELYETICSISASSLGRSHSVESLLVAFPAARFAILSWDAQRHRIATRSIHDFEQYNLERGPLSQTGGCEPSYTIVDPQERCLSLVFGRITIAVLPFLEVDEDEEPHAEKRPNGVHLSQPITPKTPRTPARASGRRRKLYRPSFVLNLAALDARIKQPLHIQYLNGYREPTIGALYCRQPRALALGDQASDRIHYVVASIDLDQRHLQQIVVINNLPGDIHRILPLPSSIGGALLIGHNEFIHIDQAGKPHGVAVNSFVGDGSSFSMSDQGHLELLLESSQLTVLDDAGKVLIALADGSMAILDFVLDGRAVSGLRVVKIRSDDTASRLGAMTTCLETLGPNTVFRGRSNAESELLILLSPSANGTDPELEEDLEGHQTSAVELVNKQSELESRISSQSIRIWAIGDCQGLVFGTLARPGGEERVPSALLRHGHGHDSLISTLSWSADLESRGSILRPGTRRLWTIGKSQITSSQFCIAAVPREKLTTGGESILCKMTSHGLAIEEGTEFESSAGAAVAVGTMGSGSRIVQVLPDEIKVYDEALNYSQILELQEENIGESYKVDSATFSNEHLILRDTEGHLLHYTLDDKGELGGAAKKEGPFIGACIYTDKWGVLKERESLEDKSPQCLFTLTHDGLLEVYLLPNIDEPQCAVRDVRLLPQLLAPELGPRRAAGFRELILEILVADLGDRIQQRPHLFLRTAADSLVIYRLFVQGGVLRFSKVPYVGGEPQPFQDVEDLPPLRAIDNLDGFAVVVRPGINPIVVSCAAAGSLCQNRLGTSHLQDVSSIQLQGCTRELVTLDDRGQISLTTVRGILEASQSSPILQRISSLDRLRAISFFAPHECYVAATSTSEAYSSSTSSEQKDSTDDDAESGVKPEVPQSALKLLSAVGLAVIDEYALGVQEQVTVLQTVHLLTSEHSRSTSPFIAVASSQPPTNPTTAPVGSIYIFTVSATIPHPGRPETGLKLRLVLKDSEIKGGAITAIHQLGSGFLATLHGQKLLVRGFKEDGSFLPVAFFDLPGYNTTLKVLPGPMRSNGAGNLLAFADSMRGVQLVAFSEDPYKLVLISRDLASVPVTSVEFLPHGEELFLLAQDLSLNLHLLQYKPEDPRSLSGLKLIRQATWYVGEQVLAMQLIPRANMSGVTGANEEKDDSMGVDETSEEATSYQIFVSLAAGATALITPLPEQLHRRLAALQNQLLSSIEPVAGLSYKPYRAPKNVRLGPGEGQAPASPVILDGNVLKKWRDIGRDRLGEIQRAIGMDADEIGAAVWSISGEGMSYFR